MSCTWSGTIYKWAPIIRASVDRPQIGCRFSCLEEFIIGYRYNGFTTLHNRINPTRLFRKGKVQIGVRKTLLNATLLNVSGVKLGSSKSSLSGFVTMQSAMINAVLPAGKM